MNPELSPERVNLQRHQPRAGHGVSSHIFIAVMPLSISSLWHRKKQDNMVHSNEHHAQPSKSRPLRIAVPLYIYPGESAWNALIEAATNHPSTHFDVVVNPHNGPGGAVPDTNYIRQIAQLNTLRNVKIFGYVHTLWGDRDVSLVKTDIDTYEKWSRYADADIHVSGIFLDEAPSAPDLVGHMREIYDHARASLSRGSTVWTNPGVAVNAAYFRAADLINVFENTHEQWDGHVPASDDLLRGKSTVMIHTYRGGSVQLKRDTAGLIAKGYHGGMITTKAGYEAFSDSWLEFVKEIQTRCQ